jgi:hypothetical protein
LSGDAVSLLLPVLEIDKECFAQVVELLLQVAVLLLQGVDLGLVLLAQSLGAA